MSRYVSYAARPAVGRAAIAVVAVLVVAGALVVGVLVEPPVGSSSPSAAGSEVVARAIDPSGEPVTNATYALGQELLLSVTVPSSTHPVAVHQVFSDHAYGELAWNVTATHFTYLIDSGPADPADVGVDHVYAVVTFADGSTARSNNVTMTVTN